MHAQLRLEVDRLLATLATPVENGSPVRAGSTVTTVDGKLRYQAVWLRDGARQPEPFGPLFEYPRDASNFVAEINRRSGADRQGPIE